jgi:FkbH-like protein
MFQFEWGNKIKWAQLPNPEPYQTRVDKKTISKILDLQWEDHCQECAATECYSTCALYSKRPDGHCTRFEYGIIPNRNFSGLYPFGADLQFKKWGKLEAKLDNAQSTPARWARQWGIRKRLARSLRYLERLLIKPKETKGKLIKFKDTKRKREILFDEFIFECHSTEKTSYTLLLEYFIFENNVRKTLFRYSFCISPGYNLHRIPYHSFGIAALEGLLYLYPEHDEKGKRLIITWLDFVKYRKKAENAIQIRQLPTMLLPRIKCVVWDLDNTLWEGILSEDSEVRIRPNAVSLIREFDELGILQSIVSKNSHAQAWQELVKAGIADFFLYPAINWWPKSENLLEISKKLNIGLDTFAVIDDAAFEREEIKKFLPQVRVYDETQLNSLLAREEFKVAVSASSPNRRQSYQESAAREGIMKTFSGGYEDFLISCGMELELFVPETDVDQTRCWELIQRSNQLNMSFRRHTREEFRRILDNKTILSLALNCRDRFGDYGLIGYINFELSSDGPVMKDLVISCRVAQKKIEHTLVKAVSRFLAENEYTHLYASVVFSGFNAALEKAFAELPFEVVSKDNQGTLLKLSLDDGSRLPDIMALSWKEDHLNKLFAQLASVR